MALPSPRTFVQKIKKRRLFQPSLLYLHYCKTFLLPWVAFMRSDMSVREPFYVQASLVVDCDPMSDEELIEYILGRLTARN